VSDDVVDRDAPDAVADAEAEATPGDERSDAERQRDDYLDALQRLQADFENYRKRVARASEDAASRAAGALVAKLLPVIDALDLAQAHFATEGSEEAVALTQSRGLLLDTLAREGLTRIDVVEVPFDPQVHDAVAHEAGDGEQVIVEVLRAGYQWKGAVIRPAMVRVKG
jgi:molecular chaperone GrpE